MHSGLSTLNHPKIAFNFSHSFWILLIFAAGIFFSPEVLGHERWVLTPSQILAWNARPKPELYTSLGPATLLVIGLSILVMVSLVHLHYSGANEIFPALQAYLSSLQAYASVALRFGLSWVLISSALGLEPRVGVPVFEHPTLLAPDLDISVLGPAWAWLRWFELGLGVGFLLGIYVRVLCIGLMLLIALTWMQFYDAVFSYLPSYTGVAIYLFLRGPGHIFLPLPTMQAFQPLVAALENQPVQRAQWFLRVFTGINLLYLALYFKVMQPNLALAVITIYEIPILSSAPEVFVMVMTVVEVLAGLLIIMGILLRFLSIVLLCAFFFFAACLTEAETFTSHILFYGIILTFLFNGSGHWSRPEAKDKSAHILIAGGGFAALHAALQLVRLRGAYSNIAITVVTPQLDFQFKPLLAEVVGGSVQPGNVVNPFRRLLPNTKVLCGHISHLDTQKRHAMVTLTGGEKLKVVYGEFVYAPDPVPDFTLRPGTAEYACTLDTVGDALHLRQRILQNLNQAEQTQNPQKRLAKMTFCILGGGERGCALAVEIRRLLDAARPSYPILQQQTPNILVFEESGKDADPLPEGIYQRRAKLLSLRGITILPLQHVVEIEASGIRLSNQKRLPSSNIINVSYRMPAALFSAEQSKHYLPFDEYLQVQDAVHHWAASGSNRPRIDVNFLISRQIAQGNTAAYNAWASSQDFAFRPFKASRKWLYEYHMGKDALSQFLGIPLPRFLSWIIQRARCLNSLPGLERSLRIGIDWVLDGIFHNDIALVSPSTSRVVQAKKTHQTYSAGQPIVKKGQQLGQVYLICKGQVAIVEQDKQLSTLKAGDAIGEREVLAGRAFMFDTIALNPVEIAAFSPQQWSAFRTMTVNPQTT